MPKRKGLTLLELTRMFPDDRTAEEWFIKVRWPHGVACMECGSLNIQTRPTRKPQPFRCRDCRKDFSAKTGTVLHGSKLGFRIWAIAIYIHATGIKGTSSMKLHRDLGITQKTAWYLSHRIREAWEEEDGGLFPGPVQMDEVYIGGRARNRPLRRRVAIGGGSGHRIPVLGIWNSNHQVRARVMERTGAGETAEFFTSNVAPGARLFTDEWPGYRGFPNREAVRHGMLEYARGDVTTNGIESFWSLLKRAHYGTFHSWSRKHLFRYVKEFVGRYNAHSLDTIERMRRLAARMEGRRLRFADLIS